jgi:hypothetical protein
LFNYEITIDRMSITTAQDSSYDLLYWAGSRPRLLPKSLLQSVNLYSDMKVVQSREKDGKWTLESVELALKVPTNSLQSANLKCN